MDDAGEEEDREVDEETETDRERRRRRLESMLPEVLKRAIEKGFEAGVDTITKPGEALRGVLGEKGAKLPKEMVGYMFSQVDDTKNAMVRVVAHEIRDFLTATDLSTELQKVLTSLSFEIRTEIRFIPNDKGGIKPEIKAHLDPSMKRTSDDEE